MSGRGHGGGTCRSPWCWVLWGCWGSASARPTVRAEVPASSSTVILALDVSGSMCATDVAAEPVERRAGGRAVVRGGTGRGDEDRPRRVLRVRPAGGGADDPPGRAPGGPRCRDDGTRDDDRIGDPPVDRRDRRAGPERGAVGPRRRADDGRARPRRPDSHTEADGRWARAAPVVVLPVGGGRGAGDHRAAHGRGEHAWRDAVPGGRAGRGARGAGLSDRLRHDEPDADGVHARPVRQLLRPAHPRPQRCRRGRWAAATSSSSTSPP